MATTSPINALPAPDDNSPNDPPIHFNALNTQLDTRLLARFATTTARDAAITSPVNGMSCWVDSPGAFYDRSGGAWVERATPPRLTAMSTSVNWSTPAGRAQQVYKDNSGLIQMVGLIQNDLAFTIGGTEVPLIIPAGFRPAAFQLRTMANNAYASPVTVQIQTNGQLLLLRGPGAFNAATYFDLGSVAPWHPTATA